MSMAGAVWGAHIRGIGNALRTERKMQVSWIIAIVFDLVVGIWSFNALRSNLPLWRAAGIDALDLRLWTICIVAWLGLGMLAVLTLLQKNFGSDEPIFLLTLPIAPASFFRIFYVIVLVEGSGNWIIGTSLVLGIALAGVIGWQALIWVFLLLTGMAVITWFSMLLTSFALRYILPYLKIVLIGAVILMLAIAGIFALTRFAWLVLPGPVFVQPAFSTQAMPVELQASLFFLVLFILQWGVFSRWAGNLYLGIFRSPQNRFAARTDTRNLWADSLESIVGESRTILGAMLFKGILNQSRSILTWLRLVMMGIFLALFVPVQTALAPFHIAQPVLVIGYAATLGLLLMLEVGLNAIGGEGDRLTLYLLMPIKLKDILLTRWFIFLAPGAFFSLVTSLILSVVLGFSLIQTLLVALNAIFLVCASLTLLVLGSAWDEDLDVSIEGWMQAILYEELPASPRRLLIFNASLVFHAALILLVVVLPLWLSPVILILLAGLILFTLLYGSTWYITKLVDKN